MRDELEGERERASCREERGEKKLRELDKRDGQQRRWPAEE